jgi:predicted DNA-binding protein (MmcQ/YjbR family)
MAADPIARVRRICLKFPEATEVEAWGSPTFRVRNKLFAMYVSANASHGAGRPSLWCKAKPLDQDLLIHSLPERIFKPPYVGPSGWVGVWLDKKPDWEMVKDIVSEAYALAAPKRLLTSAKAGGASAPSRARSAGARRRG